MKPALKRSLAIGFGNSINVSHGPSLVLKDRLSMANMALYLAGLTVAVALKYHYSRADAEYLNWILYPTSLLVEMVGGLSFTFEAHLGYIDRSRGIVIAPACAGVNFMIIAFCTVFFSLAYMQRSRMAKWVWVGKVMLSSYFLTLIVNCLRIIISVFLYEHGVHWGWLTPERVHRIGGAIVYFFFLYLFYFAAVKINERNKPEGGNNRNAEKVLERIFPGTSSTPVFWYILLAIVAPLINGGYRRYGAIFIEHAVTAVLTSFIVFFLISLLRLYSGRILYNIDTIKTWLSWWTAGED